MFIKNMTDNYQSFTVNGSNLFLAPQGDRRDTVALDDEWRDDVILQRLLASGTLAEVGAEEAIERQEQIREEIAEEQAQKEEIKVVTVNDTKENDIRLVKCAAVKANGQHCTYNVQVPFHEYDSDKPYFCGRHKKEDPDKYEKVDGEWVRKVAPVE